MKIALYQPWIYLYGGIERSILALMKHSRHQWTIFTGHYEPHATFPEFSTFDVKELTRLSVKRDITSVMRAAMGIYSQKIPLQGYDALVIWCDGLGDMAVFRNHSLPVFNICSTPLRAAFDPVYESQALRTRGVLKRMAYRIFKHLFIWTDRVAWRYYDGVIATSREVQERIIRGKLFQDGNRMKLYHPGIEWNRFDFVPHYEPFFLVPGRIMWTKNIELAVKAFLNADLPQSWRLVVAGFVDEKSKPYFARLRHLAAENERINFETAPTDDRMVELYRRTSAVLFPPLNEDWGIVPLEAMASAKPVLANACGGPLESIQNGETGWLLPSTTAAWSRQLEWIIHHMDRVRQMARLARAYSAQYDWSVFASGVDNTLETWAIGARSIKKNNAISCSEYQHEI